MDTLTTESAIVEEALSEAARFYATPDTYESVSSLPSSAPPDVNMAIPPPRNPSNEEIFDQSKDFLCLRRTVEQEK